MRPEPKELAVKLRGGALALQLLKTLSGFYVHSLLAGVRDDSAADRMRAVRFDRGRALEEFCFVVAIEGQYVDHGGAAFGQRAGLVQRDRTQGRRCFQVDTTFDQPVIEEWTGLRPMTYDDLPIIGPVPHMDNLIIATGHGMLGLTMATGTGKAVCDLLTNGKPSIDLAAFSLDRFS